MANLRVSLRKRGASNFETGDKFLPETDWAFILNKPATFVPDPHNHTIAQVTGLQGVLDGKVGGYQSVNGLDMNNVTESGFYYGYNMTNAALTTISTFMVIKYSNDWIIQKQFVPSGGGNREFIRSRHSGTTWSSWAEIPDKTWVTNSTRSNTWVPSWSEVTGKPSVIIEGDARLTNARPASDVSSWAKAENKPPYSWGEITSKPSWIGANKPTYDLGEISETTTYKRVTEAEKGSWSLKADITDIEVKIGEYDADITPIINGKLSSSLKGSANGLAELDANGKVPSTQLPSFVDDVLEFTNLASFPTTGESGKIYIDLATNKTYRWGGSGYVVISETISLGETSSTAYRGDRGKIAYDHSQVAHAPSNAQKNSDITKAEIEAKLTGAITSHTHTYNLDQISDGSTYKRVTQSEKNTWSGKENAITKGTVAQYFRGDMSLATFPTIPTIPSLMTQADITNSTSTQRTINGSTLSANFYDKTNIDLLMSGKQNSLGFTPVPATRTIAGLDLTANRTRDQILGVSANGYVRRTGANTYDIRTVANLKSDLGLGTLASYNGLALNDLTNVTFGGTPTAGQVLTYGSGVWTNITPATPAYAGMGISRTISADNTYDLLSTDLNKLIIVNAYSGCAFIITTAFNNAAAIGAEVQFFNKSGAAAEVYTTASGVTLLSESNKMGFSGFKTMAAIKKISSTEWILVGALT